MVFDVIAFPINPADIAFCCGNYRLRPPLPATPGAECIGRVTAVGAGVDHVKPGDHVINLMRENWAQQMLDGKLDAPVAAVYPIEQIAEAVAHAQRDAKGGKILVAPNGMI